MTEFRPNPLYQHGIVTTNGDGLSIDDVSPLFREHRQAVIDAQSEAAVAKVEAQKAKDAAEAAARLAEQARQDAETKAAQAAALESQVQVAEAAVAEASAEEQAVLSEAAESKTVRRTRTKKATEPTE